MSERVTWGHVHGPRRQGRRMENGGLFVMGGEGGQRVLERRESVFPPVTGDGLPPVCLYVWREKLAL